MTTTPPAPNSNSSDPTGGATTPRRRGLPGWAWAAIGALVVIGVVVAGVMIAGRNHATPTPAPGGNTTSPTHAPITTTPEPTASPTPGETQIGEWSVEILEYKADVTDYLANADPPVTPSIEGHRFLGIKLRVTNTGERADPYLHLAERLRGTTNGHPLYEPYQVNVTRYRGDDSLAGVPRLETGESGEGWLFYQVRGDFELTGIDMRDERDRDNPTLWTEVPYPQPTNTTPTPTGTR
ncbi:MULTISPECIES: hypothetical protein [unclassified Actinobaculum]|uniref:hypothetical protein n=1 Tax=unclassified Actinobaculum TaxID=2609299 RepID=UPI000D525D1B|nr:MULTISPECIES: hypothetical protein [unclassified Actinobaculum]AWE42605.1 hypothetical protein DDD63_07415 [Actinobaculum sp. 313]RTE48098.1 hypothetical protein EKN07_10810 [Actinobaculum sp. 352]